MAIKSRVGKMNYGHQVFISISNGRESPMETNMVNYIIWCRDFSKLGWNIVEQYACWGYQLRKYWMSSEGRASNELWRQKQSGNWRIGLWHGIRMRVIINDTSQNGALDHQLQNWVTVSYPKRWVSGSNFAPSKLDLYKYLLLLQGDIAKIHGCCRFCS